MSATVDTKTQAELFSFTRTGRCINCGTCSAVCPLPRENVLLPRQLLRLLNLGREEALIARADTVFSCLLCRLCEETCPAGVDIPACVRFLRGYLNRNVHHLDGE
jgi:heterodisulfide reductase subunit C